MSVNRSIREWEQLNRQYGVGRWRKRKGIATIRYMKNGRIVNAEIHWYEAHGIGATNWIYRLVQIKREFPTVQKQKRRRNLSFRRRFCFCWEST